MPPHWSPHCQQTILPNPHQSAYCKHHSTETALLYIQEDLIYTIGSQKSIKPLPSWSLCCLWHHWPHLNHLPLSHLGSVSMALFAAGSSVTYHLAPFVLNVITTCCPFILPLVVFPKALFSALYSSSCTPTLSSHWSDSSLISSLSLFGTK